MLRQLEVLGSVALIAVATLSPFLSSPSTTASSWCVQCSSTWLADALLNIVLFAPLGVVLSRRGMRGSQTVLIATALSFFVEFLQAAGVPSGRSASLLDILSNGMGAAVGWLLTRTLPRIFASEGQDRQTHAIVWSLLIAVILWGSALGTQSETNDLGDVRPSSFAYAPGFGWYGGTPIEARVGDARIAHRGDGPIVLESERQADSIDIRLRTTGRDSSGLPRAVLLLHTASDSMYSVVILQHHDAAVANVRRFAQHWGLFFPSLAISNVFPESGATDTVDLRLVVSASQITMVFGAETASSTADAVLSLTPLLGWSMLQGVVRPRTFAGLVASVVWILLIFVPFGWLCGRVGQCSNATKLSTWTFCGFVVVSALVGPHVVWGSALPEVWEMLWVLFAIVVGTVGVLSSKAIVPRRPRASVGE